MEETKLNDRNPTGEEISAVAGETVETVPETAQTTPRSAERTEPFFRSFQTKEELVRAYTSLEKEFTKRSQELSALKKEREAFDAEGEAERFLSAFPEAGNFAGEIAEAIAEAEDFAPGAPERAYLKILAAKKEGREEFIARAAGDREIREKVVLDYLKNLPDRLPKLSAGGRPPAAEPKKPKTLTEAGEDALKILNDKRR